MVLAEFVDIARLVIYVNVVPVFSMLTTGNSFDVSLTVVVFGTSTSMPNSITCAVSMKMMSSTSTTSTKGVTLISDSAVPPRPRRRDPYRRH